MASSINNGALRDECKIDDIDQASDVSEAITPFVTELCLTHDVRAVIAALLGRASQLSQVAIAAGCEQEIIDGMFRGTTEAAFTPTGGVRQALFI